MRCVHPIRLLLRRSFRNNSTKDNSHSLQPFDAERYKFAIHPKPIRIHLSENNRNICTRIYERTMYCYKSSTKFKIEFLERGIKEIYQQYAYICKNIGNADSDLLAVSLGDKTRIKEMIS